MEIRHQLTDAQREVIQTHQIQFQQAVALAQEAKQQIEAWNARLTEADKLKIEAETFVRKLCAYIILEQKLPELPGGYDLSQDGMCLIGLQTDQPDTQETSQVEKKTKQKKTTTKQP